jgi:hypothetical protein
VDSVDYVEKGEGNGEGEKRTKRNGRKGGMGLTTG